MVVVSGLSNRGAQSSVDGGGAHTRVHAAWLNGVLPRRTEGSDIRAGKTVDQYAADTLGLDTPLRSLELAVDNNFRVGNCENGYSCLYQTSTSWQTATRPLPHERNPRAVFQRLFGDGGTAEARLLELQRDRSILDTATEAIARLRRRLGLTDLRIVSDYLDAVREAEQHIQKMEERSETSPLPTLEPPSGVPEEFEEHVKLLFDLQVLAYQADITRVSCFQLSREINGRTYPHIGVPEGHHTVSHHQTDPHAIEQYTKICAHFTSLFMHIVKKMRDTPDGDGTLLDHTIFLYGCGLGDGDKHTPFDLPTVLVGGGSGTLQGGRHVRYPKDTPFMNLGLALLEKVGVEVDKIGDSTGPLTGL